ncbi:hypothetical protein B566_EDAN000887 [Ephemera danica]|nr:hypothetical protein B566_EDAN000887 [Ephemera danica]
MTNQAKSFKGEVHAVQCDVTKEEDVLRVIQWTRDNLGGVDVLVNNAGIGYRSPLTGIDTEQMRHTIDVNVFGLCVFTREVVKDMRDRGVNDGHIFHISSVSGQRIMDIPGSYLYGSTKHAVRVLTEGLRRELRDLKTQIRVTGISPGLVRTEIAEAAGMSKEQAEKYYEAKPHLQSKDVAEALLYALATPPHVQVHELTILPIGQLG